MTELKPCPFCGSVDDLAREGQDGYWQVACFACGAYGPRVKNAEYETCGDDVHLSGEDIAAWNERAEG